MFSKITDKIRRKPSTKVPAVNVTQPGSSHPNPTQQPIQLQQQLLSPQVRPSTGKGETPPPTYAPPASPVPFVRAAYVAPQDDEDPLEMLRDFDTVFLVDDSTSMKGSRWLQACKSIMGVAEIASRYDEDGIDIYFLNHKKVGEGLQGKRQVEALFKDVQPRGITPTGMRMDFILKNYMTKLEQSLSSGKLDEQVKPMNLIIVTDGAPTDDPESVIISCAKRASLDLDKGEYPLSQVGIQFLQVGNDPLASKALTELDDCLSSTHGIRDIVDTVPYDGKDMSTDTIIKTLLGGINRRLDKRGLTGQTPA
nr:hypothetical protein L204_01386 [Cryptococcus depauperatus CBS 7855]